MGTDAVVRHGAGDRRRRFMVAEDANSVVMARVVGNTMVETEKYRKKYMN